MQIEKHITSLLFQYDCVIIPGLGGFVANHSPSRIQFDSGMAYPPSKGIIFNKNLISNDGLLAETISREENLSYQQSTVQLQNYVLECKTKLSRGERIEFQGLGILFLDEEKNIQFQPDYSINFLVESFGLYPVVAREIIRTVKPVMENLAEEKQESKIIPIQQETEQKEQTGVRKISAFRNWAIAAAVAPIVFYSIWIPAKTDFLSTGHLEFADLNPFHSSSPSYVARAHEGLKLEVESHDEWFELVENAGGPVAQLDLNTKGNYLNIAVTEKPAAESTFVAKNNQVKSQSHLHVIGGCFRELGNAENLVSELKAQGFDSYILDEVGGLHRVAIESYSNKEEALKGLNLIREKGNDSAWLLEK